MMDANVRSGFVYLDMKPQVKCKAHGKLRGFIKFPKKLMQILKAYLQPKYQGRGSDTSCDSRSQCSLTDGNF